MGGSQSTQKKSRRKTCKQRKAPVSQQIQTKDILASGQQCKPPHRHATCNKATKQILIRYLNQKESKLVMFHKLNKFMFSLTKINNLHLICYSLNSNGFNANFIIDIQLQLAHISVFLRFSLFMTL